MTAYSSSRGSVGGPSAAYAGGAAALAPATVARGGGGAGKNHPLFTRAIVLVDAATEPGISDEEGEAKRVELVKLVLSGGDPRHGNASGNSPGAAVAFAIRKRLKSDDHVAVLNTLTLLDEIMRTCPYFYRYIANDKFFRRLWRFISPNYKDNALGKLPFSSGSKASKMAAATRSSAVNIELAERILILIRAWAEELGIMLNGQQDPDAGFFIERYSNKRMRIKFPEVPVTPTPWVCPVGPTAGRSNFASYGGGGGGRGTSKTTSPLPKSLTMSEVENTVNVFSNMLEKATDIAEVRGDLYAELAERCRLISQHIDTMSASMEKEEDLARAIKVSERLQKTLAVYDTALSTGVIDNAPPVIINGLSDGDDSEDEGYDTGPPRALSSPAGRAERYYNDRDDPPRNSAGALPLLSSTSRRRDDRDWDESDRRRADGDSSADSEAAAEEERAREERARERAKRKEQREAEKRKAEKKEAKEAKKLAVVQSTSKSSLKSDRSSKAGRSSKKEGAAESALAPSKAEKSKSGKAAASPQLVDIASAEMRSSSGSSSATDDKNDAFGLLAERYMSAKSTPSSARTPDRSPDASVTSSQSTIVAPPASVGGAVAGMQGLSMGYPGVAGQQQQQQPPPPGQAQPMGYGSVMMMPNPMGMNMYGSYNPNMPSTQMSAVPTAYGTVNPAMYYNTVNPMAYASVGGMPMAQQQVPQQPQQQAPPQAPQPVQPLPQQHQMQQQHAQLPFQPQHQTLQQLQVPHAEQAVQSGSKVATASSTEDSVSVDAASAAAASGATSPAVSMDKAPAQAQVAESQAAQAQAQAQLAQAQMAQAQAQMAQAQMSAFPPSAMSPAPPAPSPPPPPQPSAYTTVTNAAAPPPSEPPPPMPAPAAQSAAAVAVPAPQPTAPPPSAVQGQLQPPLPLQSQQMQQQPEVPMAMVAPHPSMYSSVGGQPFVGNQSFLYSSVGGVPQAPQPQMNMYGSVTGMAPLAPVVQAPIGVQGSGEQAAAYHQAAMANAAAAYQAAAVAYQSTQGQPPLQPKAADTQLAQNAPTASSPGPGGQQ